MGSFQRWLNLAFAVLPASIYVGSQTIANAVLPQMQGDLAAGVDEIAWVVTASVVAGAIGIPSTAWLSGKFGRRRLLIACMAGFSIATVLVGFTDSLAGVVLFRALAALFAAPSIAISQALVLDLFDEPQRGKAFAFWAIGILTGWIFAPTIGAYIAENYGWRVIFLSFAPVGVGCVLLATRVLDSERVDEGRFDWLSFIPLSLGIAALLLILNRGQRLDWFESGEIITWCVVAAASIYVFVVRTAMIDSPFLDWRVFKNRNYALGIPLIFLYASLSLAPLVLLPAMLKLAKGLELVTTAVALLPRGLAQIGGLLVVGPLFGWMDPRLVIAGGLTLYAVGAFQMAGFNTDIGLADVLWPNLLQGFAMALIWIPVATLVYGGLQGHLRTHGTTISSLCYSVASSVGVSLGVIVLSRSMQVNRSELVQYVHHANEVLFLPSVSSGVDLNSLASLQGLEILIQRQAAMIGYANGFFLMGVTALCAVIFALLMNKNPH